MPTFPVISEATRADLSTSFLLLLLTLFPQCILSLSLSNTPHLHSHSYLLFGDAKYIAGTPSVRLTNPDLTSSAGLLFLSKPVKFFSRYPVSFSTDFTFSISPHNGDGLLFGVFPTDLRDKFSRTSSFGIPERSRYFGVEFDTLVDETVGDVNNNHVGIDVGNLTSVKLSNVSKTNLVLNSGITLQSWIDYDSSSKRLEVRLGKFGLARPFNPLMAYRVDLGEMWNNEEAYLGLSSSSGNSRQSVIVYSWNFRFRHAPKWLHSQPLNPQSFSNVQGEVKKVERKRSCVLGFLSGLIFVTGCVALAAFVVLSLWAIAVRNQEAEIPANFDVRPGSFRYEKINVVVEDTSNDVKKQGIK